MAERGPWLLVGALSLLGCCAFALFESEVHARARHAPPGLVQECGGPEGCTRESTTCRLGRLPAFTRARAPHSPRVATHASPLPVLRAAFSPAARARPPFVARASAGAPRLDELRPLRLDERGAALCGTRLG
eukprot:3729766-Prymnesium_polylepis.1